MIGCCLVVIAQARKQCLHDPTMIGGSSGRAAESTTGETFSLCGFGSAIIWRWLLTMLYMYNLTCAVNYEFVSSSRNVFECTCGTLTMFFVILLHIYTFYETTHRSFFPLYTSSSNVFLSLLNPCDFSIALASRLFPCKSSIIPN